MAAKAKKRTTSDKKYYGGDRGKVHRRYTASEELGLRLLSLYYDGYTTDQLAEMSGLPLWRVTLKLSRSLAA